MKLEKTYNYPLKINWTEVFPPSTKLEEIRRVLKLTISSVKE